MVLRANEKVTRGVRESAKAADRFFASCMQKRGGVSCREGGLLLGKVAFVREGGELLVSRELEESSERKKKNQGEFFWSLRGMFS